MSEQTIRAIYGHEPRRENEYPSAFMLNHAFERRTVTSIVFRDHYMGDHSEGWFDVFAGDERLCSVSSRAVAEVHYELEPKP